ncbi:DUF1990 family protein [Candidatus Uabimicrobium sp. HlEnr_7]|uniref:DUF1990 family protein n=1 Tax=Candidatus Uabimicrobium helgolandensis TaxID=3095367 RepID=UPI0035564241
MLYILRPSPNKMPKLLKKWQKNPLTYSQVGCTKNEEVPKGFNKDKRRVLLGNGEDIFTKAKEALKNWKMYDVSWMDVHRPFAPLEKDETSVTFIKLFGIWFGAIPCRIVYTINECHNGVTYFGFAFGTVKDHPEVGEEKFVVEWHHQDDSVWYEVCAISKPGHFLTKCGYPVMRYLQGCFFRDTQKAMQRSVK